ncbi:MAG: anti-sigma factor antagonist [Anaerolineales bacterium]|nr:anti-sigma factor antagonist [Anaerolineales bacterium]
MNIEIEHPQEGKIVVRPQGRVDIETGPVLKERLQDLVKTDGLTVVVDLKEVDFIDSSGLSALVSGLKALREREGTMHLVQPQPQARTALRLTLLDRVFSIFLTIEQALNNGELLDT